MNTTILEQQKKWLSKWDLPITKRIASTINLVETLRGEVSEKDGEIKQYRKMIRQMRRQEISAVMSISDFDSIAQVIYRVTRVGKEQLKSKNQKCRYVNARCLFTNAIREYFPNSTYSEIGGYLSGRDHSTIIHYTLKHGDLMATDEEYRNRWEKVKRILNDSRRPKEEPVADPVLN